MAVMIMMVIMMIMMMRIATSQLICPANQWTLICPANQWTAFYMIVTLVVKG